jgi:hypothetical protein
LADDITHPSSGLEVDIEHTVKRIISHSPRALSAVEGTRHAISIDYSPIDPASSDIHKF